MASVSPADVKGPARAGVLAWLTELAPGVRLEAVTIEAHHGGAIVRGARSGLVIADTAGPLPYVVAALLNP